MVYIPVKQHIGSPAVFKVAKGDKVKVGTLLAEADGIVSANVHSSVAGEVIKIDELPDSNGYPETVIAIKLRRMIMNRKLTCHRTSTAILPKQLKKLSVPSAEQGLSA